MSNRKKEKKAASEIYTVERVLDVAVRDKKIKFFLKWDGWDKPSDNTWEPTAHLEDFSLVHLFQAEQESLKSASRDPNTLQSLEEKISLCKEAAIEWHSLRKLSMTDLDSPKDEGLLKKGQSKQLWEVEADKHKEKLRKMEDMAKSSKEASFNHKKAAEIKGVLKDRSEQHEPGTSKPKEIADAQFSAQKAGFSKDLERKEKLGDSSHDILKKREPPDFSKRLGAEETNEEVIFRRKTKRASVISEEEQPQSQAQPNEPATVRTHQKEERLVTEMEKLREERGKAEQQVGRLQKDKSHIRRELERVCKENTELKAMNERLLKKRESSYLLSQVSFSKDPVGQRKPSQTQGSGALDLSNDEEVEEGRLDHDKIAKIDGCICVGSELLVEVIWKPSNRGLIKRPRLVPLQILLNSSNYRGIAQEFLIKTLHSSLSANALCKKEFRKIREANQLLISQYKSIISTKLSQKKREGKLSHTDQLLYA
jgi:Chromo (CHRromatin Organisation MOdifier) domain